MRVLAVADSDSRWKWASLVADAIAGDRGTVDGVLVDVPSAPSQRQLEEVGADIGRLRSIAPLGLTDPATFHGYDVVVVGGVGTIIYTTVESIAAMDPTQRPVSVTGYVGVVFEKDLEGLIWRLGADVICMNAARDLERFRGYCELLGVDPSALVRSGLPSVPERTPVAVRPVKTVTFAVQPDVPRGWRERRYVLERLIGHAEANPDRQVVVKLRARPEEASARTERYHYETLHEEHGLSRPPNLEFAYGYMIDVLRRTDLCVTVSSTAAIEALSHGVPVGIITDFGIRESHGNHFFLGSGCLVSFDELDAGAVPKPNQDWMDDNGLSDDDRLENVTARVDELLRRRAQPGGLPPAEPWARRDRTTYMLDALDARLRDAATPPGTVSLPRRAVRKVLRGPARSMYARLDAWANGG